MEQVRTREQMQYDGLGWRAGAVIVDTLVVLLASSILLVVLSVTDVLDLGLRNAATLNDIYSASRAAPGWLMPLEYGFIFLYFTLFELGGSTPGKRIFRLTVTMDDGTRPTSIAVVVRNLIRIPEMYLLYAPSAIACLASSKNKRLGDLAAKTVVVRRGAAPVGVTASGPVQSWPAGGPLPPAPPLGRAPVAPGLATPAPASPSTYVPAATAAPAASEALAGLKTAALAVRGAHLNYLRFSEVELAKGAGGAAGEPADQPADRPEPEYSPEYAAAWYTLADAVIAMQQAHAAAIAAASREGTTLPAVCADQPDLTYLFRELEPYFTAGSDDHVHDAYMSVARGETTA